MRSSVMIDLAIAAVFILCTAMGWRRGLFRSLAELAAMALALVLASQIAAAAAPVVIDKALRPAAYEALEERIDELEAGSGLEGSPLEGARALIEAIPNRLIRESALALLEDVDLKEAAGDVRAAVLGAGRQAVDAVLDGAVYRLVHSLLYVVCFMALTFLLRLAVRLLSVTMRLPVLKQCNEAGGALLGMGKGAVLVCLGVWVLGRTGVITPELAEGSLLLGPLAKWTGAFGGGLSV